MCRIVYIAANGITVPAIEIKRCEMGDMGRKTGDGCSEENATPGDGGRSSPAGGGSEGDPKAFSQKEVEYVV